jgi:hypothetical protein
MYSNYPMGVTDADIDEHYGCCDCDCDECDDCDCKENEDAEEAYWQHQLDMMRGK